jgi:hypothetical protein
MLGTNWSEMTEGRPIFQSPYVQYVVKLFKREDYFPEKPNKKPWEPSIGPLFALFINDAIYHTDNIAFVLCRPLKINLY